MNEEDVRDRLSRMFVPLWVSNELNNPFFPGGVVDGWTLVHFLSGMLVGTISLFFPAVQRKRIYIGGFILHTAWEWLQHFVLVTRGSFADFAWDTIYFMGGLALITEFGHTRPKAK